MRGGANNQFLNAVGAATAHEVTRGAGALVGVIDSGIDSRHREFNGWVPTFAVCSSRGAVVSSRTVDYTGHGTAVTSIVAGRHIGVAPECDLAVAAVTGVPGGGDLESFLVAMEWLRGLARGDGRTGADVILASLWFDLDGNDADANERLGAILTSGGLLVAAAGNGGPVTWPAAFSGAVAVGPLDGNSIASNASRGHVGGRERPDLWAPGVAVSAAFGYRGYLPMTGSSFAAPFVAGAAALVMAANPKAQLGFKSLDSHQRPLRHGVGRERRLYIDADSLRSTSTSSGA
ncbi:MAG: S8 family serine peptidase [Myxococcales bacterium]|nr:S8 family serine peptidase [Myxococcales bacterium]